MAMLLAANGARKFLTAIGVYKKLYRFSEPLPDQTTQVLYLSMRFLYIQVPGNGKVAVTMKPVAVFNEPHIMEVYPILPAVLI